MVPHPGITDAEGMDEQTATMSAPSWYERPVARNPDEKMVGGVIGGVSPTYGFDVRTTRIAMVIVTIVLPILALVYLAAWVLLPSRPTEAASLKAIAGDRRRLPLYIAIGIVVVAGGIGSLGSWFIFGGVPWGLGLIAIGVLLWVAPGIGTRSRQPGASPWAPPSDAGYIPSNQAPTDLTSVTDVTNLTDVTDATATDTTIVGAAHDTATFPVSASWTTPAPSPAATPNAAQRRVRRPIGACAVVAAFGFAAFAAFGDAVGWWDITLLAGLLTVLAILAGGAAISAAVNRSWWPVPGMLMAGGLLTMFAITTPNLEGGTGSRHLQPTELAQLDQRTTLGIGELTIDLTDIDLSTGRVPLEIEVGIGRLLVVVPDDATLELTSTLGAGELRINGQTVAEGIRHDDRRTLAATGATGTTGTAGPVYAIDANVGMGQIEIVTAP
jgi:phage shock protein PspC (stress-responsive transcriptional regulator)